MLALMTLLGVMFSSLVWRLYGVEISLQVLLAMVAVLLVAARSWFHPVGRFWFDPPDAPYVDLEQQRLAEVDAYVSERLAQGDSVAQIASSASWFDNEGGTHGRAG